MSTTWPLLASVVAIMGLFATVNLAVVKWMIDHNNQLLMERLSESKEREDKQDSTIRDLDDSARRLAATMEQAYIRRTEVDARVDVLSEKIDLIWKYLRRSRHEDGSV